MPAAMRLFTLVGIAGEDDIDAPDLNAPTPTAASGIDEAASTKNKSLNGGQPQSSPQQKRGDRNVGERGTQAGPRSSPPLLDPEASSALRDELATELKAIGSAEEAAAWAYRVLGAKSTLVAADAKQIEAKFRQKLAEFKRPDGVGKRRKVRSRKSDRLNASASIDKSKLDSPRTPPNSRSRACAVRY